MLPLAHCLKGSTCRVFLLSLVVFALIGSLSHLKLGQTLENQALDRAYRFRPSPLPAADLLIVAIDEPSFQELKLCWPWPRRKHAELVQRLHAAGVRLIVFNVLFSEPSVDPEDDRRFAEALRQAGNVFLPQTFEVAEDQQFSRRILVQPIEPFRRAAQGVGLSMVTPDDDGVVRRFVPYLAGQETLPALVAQEISGRPPETLVPGANLIDYLGPPRTLEVVSYYQILDPDHPYPAARLRGRVVLVGHMLEASGQLQAHPEALYTPFFGSSGHLMAGVEVQANILHTLVRGSNGRELSGRWRLGFYLAILLVFGLAMSRLAPGPGLAVLGLAILALWGGSFGIFAWKNLWMPPVWLSLGLSMVYGGAVLTQYLVEVREKRWLRHAFSRYVSSRVIEVISADPRRLDLGGEEMEVTVLFADLAGFTALSEETPPDELIRILNEYFTPMTRIIQEHQGTLDKYIGDSIMALWGAPLPLKDHAILACQAALEMQRQMRLLQVGWRIRGLTRLGARLGIHSGPVVAGNVGSKERFDYTVLGDAVNLASRLEGVNKVYGTQILLSEATYRRLNQEFFVRELDRVQVKGRGEPVTVYELVGFRNPEAGPPVWLTRFAQGRAAYQARDWPQAAARFREVLTLKKGDRPTQIFLARCLGFQKYPPPPDWNGVYLLESK
jgi:adenylate cyclase